jgi:hypothetical protein
MVLSWLRSLVAKGTVGDLHMPKRPKLNWDISIGSIVTIIVVLANLLITSARYANDVDYLKRSVEEVKMKQAEIARALGHINSRIILYDYRLGFAIPNSDNQR